MVQHLLIKYDMPQVKLMDQYYQQSVMRIVGVISVTLMTTFGHPHPTSNHVIVATDEAKVISDSANKLNFAFEDDGWIVNELSEGRKKELEDELKKSLKSLGLGNLSGSHTFSMNNYPIIQSLMRLNKNGVPADKTYPLSGSGGTGKHPNLFPIPAWDLSVFKNSRATREEKNEMYRKYGNPSSFNNDWGEQAHPEWNDYLKKNYLLRLESINLVLDQPIITIFDQAYSGRLPTRKEVILKAAETYALEPELVAAVILNEQHDQSHNEDLADFYGANIVHANTSIGLGQILVSTASRRDSFAALLPFNIRRPLLPTTTDSKEYEKAKWTPSPEQMEELSWLLTSEELNIFATAQYVRWLANLSANPAYIEMILGYPLSVPLADALSNHGTSERELSLHSVNWSNDARRLIASFYTRTPYSLLYPGSGCWALSWGDASIEHWHLMYAFRTFPTHSRPQKANQSLKTH